MDKLWTVTVFENHKCKQVPIVLGDDWLVSNVNLVDEDGYVCLLNTCDGRVAIVRLHDLILTDPMRTRKTILTPVSKTMIDGITQMANTEFYSIKSKIPNYIPYTNKSAKVEKPFYMPTDLFEAVDFTNLGIINEPKNSIPMFVKGEKYALSGVSCEGFEMPEKVYELIGVHDEYEGEKINSVIVKQVSGERDKIFTLSKNDCDCIGIEYEDGLQLFPKFLNWKRVKDILPFDKHNLGTTPVSDIDNTIRYVVLKLKGFKDYSDGYIVTPSGKLIKEEQFANTFKIVSNEPIVYEKPSGTFNNGRQGLMLAENVPLHVELVYPNGLVYNHGNFISSEDTIYIMIKFAKNVILSDTDTMDGLLGVERSFLDGFNPNEHFQISWDELGAYTVEEYEAEKARKEKLRQERIAKEERERQKKIEEEEKRIKEQKKRIEESVERMKNYTIKTPKFPKMPNIKVESGLSSLNLYMDGLDAYFDTLDKSLNNLSKDLNGISKIIGIDLGKSTKINNSSIFDVLKL